MSEVLYRKYRPKTFAEVLSQEVIKTTLQNAIRLGRLSHAYLFTGPRGVGKTTIARILAKTVNCLAPKDGEPDTTCENCVLIQQGRFLDLIEIDAASYTGVDNIREIIEHVKFSPSFGKYKVFIIDEVHMLSKAAFNALLKTLEEPPAHAIFILATTEIHKVPATIISRTQRFDFKAVLTEDILQLFTTVLKEQSSRIAPAAQQLIATAAGGSFRDALSILDQILSFGGDEIGLSEVEDILGITRIEVSQNFLNSIIEKNSAEAIALVNSLVSAGKDQVQFVKNFLEYLRTVLLVKMTVRIDALGLAAADATTFADQAKALTGARLLEIIKNFLEAYREMKTAPLAELPLFTAILALAPEAEREEKVLHDKPRPTLAGELDQGTIVARWAEVLARVKEYNHSLISSLRLARIVRVDGADLVLAFPYNFHKDAVESRKNRIIIEQVLTEVFASDLKIKALLEREVEGATKPGDDPDLLREAMRVMGNLDEQS